MAAGSDVILAVACGDGHVVAVLLWFVSHASCRLTFLWVPLIVLAWSWTRTAAVTPIRWACLKIFSSHLASHS